MVDAAGKWVTPGLIHAGSSLGIRLTDSGAQEETQEDVVLGEVKASFNVAEAIDPASMTIPVVRAEGVTTALTMPLEGLIPGQAVVIDLAGDRLEDMLVRSPAAMIVDLGQGGKTGGGGSRAGALFRLRLILRDAKEYAQRKEDFRKAQIQPLSAPAPELEALQPVLAGELPMLVIANRRSDIASALRIAKEFGLRIVIWGGAEAWEIALGPGACEGAGRAGAADRRAAVRRAERPAGQRDAAPEGRRRGRRGAAGRGVLAGPADGRRQRGAERHELGRRAPLGDPRRRHGARHRSAHRIARARQGGERRGLVGRPVRVLQPGGARVHPGVEVPLTNRQTELRERYRKLPPAR